MKQNEIELIHLYNLLNISKYKAKQFTKAQCEVPAELATHIANLEAEIEEKENACK